MIDALLVYPKLGSLDTMVVDLPLSILYAAAESVKRDYNVELVDLRVVKGDWRQVLMRYLDQRVLLVGVSVMTGQPLINAREVAQFVRRHSPETKIAWGGPHATVVPETIEEEFLDFLVRGYGSVALADLVGHLKQGRPELGDIKGLSYRVNGQAIHNERSPYHEIIQFRDVPYHLLNVLEPRYQRAYNGEAMFSLFSSIGCPYRCSFCVHPTIYKVINPPKWIPLPEKEVVDHIEYAVEQFGTKNICFIDDTSFPDLQRMTNIFEMIIQRRLNVKLEFRGARINELDRMTDDFIRLMIKAGTRVLKVGAESGSDRLLKTFQKGITREQIIRVNRKFARYPELVIDYNFFCGAPGETYEDLRITKDLVLQLIRENHNAYYSWGSDWKPIPGSKLLEIAQRDYGFKAPRTLDEWAEMDSFDSSGKIVHPWYTRKHNNLIKMMQLAGFVVDEKILKETASQQSLPYRLLRLLARVYKPFAMFRLKYNVFELLLEYNLYRLMIDIFPKLQTVNKGGNNDDDQGNR